MRDASQVRQQFGVYRNSHVMNQVVSDDSRDAYIKLYLPLCFFAFAVPGPLFGIMPLMPWAWPLIAFEPTKSLMMVYLIGGVPAILVGLVASLTLTADYRIVPRNIMLAVLVISILHILGYVILFTAATPTTGMRDIWSVLESGTIWLTIGLVTMSWAATLCSLLYAFVRRALQRPHAGKQT